MKICFPENPEIELHKEVFAPCYRIQPALKALFFTGIEYLIGLMRL
jgi:hypothetical protein